MLVALGKKTPEAPTLQSRLFDCHARIRKFCALARRLAGGAAAAEAREAAAALDRYFSIALPLHIADEEESLAPRLLRLADPALSDRIGVMMAEHIDVDAHLDELIERWREIGREPTAARCSATSVAAQRLAVQLEHHITDEERQIFPALARLPPDQVTAILAEFRSRRGE